MKLFHNKGDGTFRDVSDSSGSGFGNPDAEVVGQVGGRAHPERGRGLGQEAAVGLLDGRRGQGQHVGGEHPLGQVVAPLEVATLGHRDLGWAPTLGQVIQRAPVPQLGHRRRGDVAHQLEVVRRG